MTTPQPPSSSIQTASTRHASLGDDLARADRLVGERTCRFGLWQRASRALDADDDTMTQHELGGRPAMLLPIATSPKS